MFGWQENKLCLNSAALFYCFLLFTPPFGEWREGGGGDGDFALFFFFFYMVYFLISFLAMSVEYKPFRILLMISLGG